MKKCFFALVLASLVISNAISEEAPKFENPKAVVIDTAPIPGSMKDAVKLINQSEDENISFEVYAYIQKGKNKPGEWKIYGEGYLKEFYDGDTIDDSPLEGKIKSIRYFAILPKGNGEYRYVAEKKRNDLYINIFQLNESTDQSYKESAYIINASEVSGIFKDNVRFICATEDKNISFTVYAFNNKDEKWNKAGVGILKGFGDTDTVSSPLKGTLQNYTYIAVVPRNEKSYTYSAKKANNDFIITVE